MFRQKSSIISHVQVRQGRVLVLCSERKLERERTSVPMQVKKTIVSYIYWVLLLLEPGLEEASRAAESSRTQNY